MPPKLCLDTVIIYKGWGMNLTVQANYKLYNHLTNFLIILIVIIKEASLSSHVKGFKTKFYIICNSMLNLNTRAYKIKYLHQFIK